MRKVWQLIAAAGVGFALALVVAGCGSSTSAARNDGKMETGKMAGEKGKMDGEKGKMDGEKGKMDGDKGKMDGDKGKMDAKM
jgi:hypothetical protein